MADLLSLHHISLTESEKEIEMCLNKDRSSRRHKDWGQKRVRRKEEAMAT